MRHPLVAWVLVLAPAVTAAQRTPAAPSDGRPGQDFYLAFQVERLAALDGPIPVRYPPALAAARPMGGTVRAEFVVDSTGVADLATWRVLAASDSLFAAAARASVAYARFVPALLGGRAVRQLVTVPFTFAPRSMPAASAPPAVPASGPPPRGAVA